MGSDNPSGAEDQQETVRSTLELDPRWVVGFVDGEGCFSVSIHRNSNAVTTGGWQLHPVFHVYQHERYRAVLEALTAVFGCGRVRPKGPNSSVWTYAVDSLRSLEANVIPFFELHRPVVKARDFDLFAGIVRAMRQKQHLTPIGFERLAGPPRLRDEPRRQAAQPQRRRDPCGILRDCTPGARQRHAIADGVEDTVRTSWRHEESGRNDLTTQSCQ